MKYDNLSSIDISELNDQSALVTQYSYYMIIELNATYQLISKGPYNKTYFNDIVWDKSLTIRACKQNNDGDYQNNYLFISWLSCFPYSKTGYHKTNTSSFAKYCSHKSDFSFFLHWHLNLNMLLFS